jgi:hypothetical protein
MSQLGYPVDELFNWQKTAIIFQEVSQCFAHGSLEGCADMSPAA